MARNIEGWKSITLFPYLIWYQCRSEQILKTLGENSKIPNRTENRICQSNNVEGKKSTANTSIWPQQKAISGIVWSIVC